jgi:large subunit ribosomal protein L24e
MVRCSFCGEELAIGKGKIYAKKDGTTYHFCSNKCEKNQIVLKRKPAKTKWTNAHNKLKKTMLTAKEQEKTENKQKSKETKKNEKNKKEVKNASKKENKIEKKDVEKGGKEK